jgi:hypothetical protein
MQVDRLAVELRQRNGFESLDLGFAMYRAWDRALFRAWAATYVPTAVVLSLVLWQHPTIVLFVVWWLKPLFDRVLLYVYSQAMFGAAPTTREVLREVPNLVRHTRLLAALTTFRLSMARSLFLPVWQLEGQRGPAARERRRVLGARTYGYAAWLTFVCVNVGYIWGLGMFLIARMLMPDDAMPQFSFLDVFTPNRDSLWLGHAANFAAFCVETVIEPYFVGAGFSLYLNRRSELEGWDLEVEFRRMAQRHAGARAPIAATAALAALVACLALVPADPCTAAEPTRAAGAPSTPSTPFAPGAVKRELKAVMDDPVFGEKKTESRWVPRAKDDAKTPAWWRALRDFMKRVAQVIDEAGRVVIWAAGGVLLALAIYLVIKHRERWRKRSAARVVPQSIFGLDVRPVSLPDDVAADARARLAAGDTRGALSLLYRGALSTLIHAGGVDFKSGDTESECWRRAAPVLSPAGGAYFRALLDAWLLTAYAHRPPTAADLVALCERWPAHFRGDALDAAATP